MLPRIPGATLFSILLVLIFKSAAESAPYGGTVTNVGLQSYFKSETDRLSRRSLEGVRTVEEWRAWKETARRQLFEMFGLWPLPEKTDLKATVTGSVETNGIVVEKIHFQSRPGLYVTANLYRPREQAGPLPAILYLSGHGAVVSNGVSYGNKVSYQHHGAWFARHGYICLVLDTLQMGEIQGIHHGTHREGMWWWNSRGYTPGGVEAWNSIRALDYLSTRPEVDATRFGATGRSGGGAYSWSIAALDDRIKAAAPVAGITDLANHVINGVVEGHCDCMFFVNTFRWDYSELAALVAPRPLLIANTDKDTIFPLDGVVRLHEKVRAIYELHQAGPRLGLLITEGPHKDTQDLQVPVFRWFNRFLKNQEPLIEQAAVRLFTPEQLRVFPQLPADQINTRAHETFVAKAESSVPGNREEWEQQKTSWKGNLLQKVFAAWPEPSFSKNRTRGLVEQPENSSAEQTHFRLKSQENVELDLITGKSSTGHHPRLLQVLDGESARGGMKDFPTNEPGLYFMLPRGVADEPADPKSKNFIQQRRRYMLLGQTLDSMRVWDIRQTILALQSQRGGEGAPLRIRARGSMAVNVLYAAIGLEGIELELSELPATQRLGPDYLNVSRFLDLPQVLSMVAEQTPVVLKGAASTDWTYTTQTLRLLR